MLLFGALDTPFCEAAKTAWIYAVSVAYVSPFVLKIDSTQRAHLAQFASMDCHLFSPVLCMLLSTGEIAKR